MDRYAFNREKERERNFGASAFSSRARRKRGPKVFSSCGKWPADLKDGQRKLLKQKRARKREREREEAKFTSLQLKWLIPVRGTRGLKYKSVGEKMTRVTSCKGRWGPKYILKEEERTRIRREKKQLQLWTKHHQELGRERRKRERGHGWARAGAVIGMAV